MFNLYKTRLKLLIRQKSNVFWTLVFPIILATCFFLAIKPAYEGDAIDTIDVGLVNATTSEASLGNAQYDGLKEILKESKINDERNLFNVYELSASEAAQGLNNGDYYAYLVCDDSDIYLHAAGNGGTYESIVKSVTESYMKVAGTMANLYTIGADIQSFDIESLANPDGYIVNSSSMGCAADTVLGHFYSLLAMVCLFGGYFGVKEITDIQANLSAKGCRVCVAPTKKSKMLISSLLAAFTIQVVEMAILLIYLCFILQVNFGPHILPVLVLCLVGNLCGLFFGAMIATLLKIDEDSKTGIVTAFSLLGCFLSGLMFVSMKYFIEKFIPILSYINPANLITDGFHSLYYFDGYDRYFLNLGILGIITAIFAVVTIIKLRRLQYASL